MSSDTRYVVLCSTQIYPVPPILPFHLKLSSRRPITPRPLEEGGHQQPRRKLAPQLVPFSRIWLWSGLVSDDNLLETPSILTNVRDEPPYLSVAIAFKGSRVMGAETAS